MPLTWWLKADIHFSEDDYFQQNIMLRLQAMTMNMKKKQINIKIHEEVEDELNVIFESQKMFWISAGLLRLGFFSTGKGDLLFRLIFATSANSFLLAEAAAKSLKGKLMTSLFKAFGISLSSHLVTVSMLGLQGESVPELDYTDINKPLILLITTEDVYNCFPPPKRAQKEFQALNHYETPEVKSMLTEDNFYQRRGL
nr:hypothetical protein [Siadenovirus sp.]